MRKSSRLAISRSVKEAIDSYPGGLCFSEDSGKPILVNQKMNTLVYELTGHTVINANIVWDELGSINEHNGCTRLSKPWFKTNKMTIDENSLIFMFPDEKIWHFRRQRLKSESYSAVQTEAAEITDLYHMSEELFENNRKLDMLKRRQQTLLKNIVQINHEKELLSTKIKIHDDLGRCLIATKKVMNEETGSREYKRLLDSWNEVISGMKSVPLQGVNTSTEEELCRVADLIGCRLTYKGEMPTERHAQLLIYSAIREALTNAVRHGGANELTVSTEREKNCWRAVISNNGKITDNGITEGGGLSNLRKTLEQEGAELSFEYDKCFALIIEIPLSAKEAKK